MRNPLTNCFQNLRALTPPKAIYLHCTESPPNKQELQKPWLNSQPGCCQVHFQKTDQCRCTTDWAMVCGVSLDNKCTEFWVPVWWNTAGETWETKKQLDQHITSVLRCKEKKHCSINKDDTLITEKHACFWLLAGTPFRSLSYAPVILCGVEVAISVQ